jgi:hypothetical protein
LKAILRPAEAPAEPAPPPPPPPTATQTEAAPAAPTPPPTRAITVTDGIPFTIVLAADIPENIAAGSQLRFTVKSDVESEGAVVFARGAAVTGQIAQAARRRLIGSTKATLRLLTVQGVDGKTYRVRALSARSGKDEPERSVETNTKPKGDDLAASAGAEYIAYVDGEQRVTVRQ